jgi:hypothetical protein
MSLAPSPSSRCSREALRGVRVWPASWMFCLLIASFRCGGVVCAADTSAGSPSFPAAFSGEGQRDSAAYAGNDACISCHQTKSDTYHHTAHYRTSGVPSLDSIHGNFNPGTNVLRTANPNLFFIMESSGKGFSQKGVMRTPNEILERAESFDVAIGSGRKGQTYLFWDGDKLYQLPVSYWTELGEWVNSPGYVDGTANFDRPIAPRCLECHASSFASRAPPENAYIKNSLLLGISCEKCHGPGAEHVAKYRSTSPPRSSGETAILNPAKLSRERQMDICALCHAGIGNATAGPLSFTPGDVLSRSLTFLQLEANAHVDVHGSQVQLLERSRCFQSSPSMSCTTCHDVHTQQRDPAAFSATCLNCHKVENCGAFTKLVHTIDRQCVTCHMPLQETAQIVISGTNGRTLQPKVRNHQIAIYPEIRLP